MWRGETFSTRSIATPSGLRRTTNQKIRRNPVYINLNYSRETFDRLIQVILELEICVWVRLIPGIRVRLYSGPIRVWIRWKPKHVSQPRRNHWHTRSSIDSSHGRNLRIYRVRRFAKAAAERATRQDYNRLRNPARAQSKCLSPAANSSPDGRLEQEFNHNRKSPPSVDTRFSFCLVSLLVL